MPPTRCSQQLGPPRRPTLLQRHLSTVALGAAVAGAGDGIGASGTDTGVAGAVAFVVPTVEGGDHMRPGTTHIQETLMHGAP